MMGRFLFSNIGDRIQETGEKHEVKGIYYFLRGILSPVFCLLPPLFFLHDPHPGTGYIPAPWGIICSATYM
jgi:hypothetical protein